MLGLALALACGRDGGRSAGASATGAAPSRPDDPDRVTVEVLNGTRRPGLAKVGMRLLRRQGLDVLFFGTGDTLVDSTLVYVRRGSAADGERVAQALGTGKVISAPDTLRRVDVSVLLGADFRPPSDPRP
ncbi:MAG: LytR C-terminal domain-containing protein [Gemmatimonadota bacterium]